MVVGVILRRSGLPLTEATRDKILCAAIHRRR
jgi:hypothetical protein